MMQLAVSADDDAEKLEAMSQTWEELRKKEKEVERSHDEVRPSCVPVQMVHLLISLQKQRCSVCIDKNSQFSLLLLLHGFSFSFFSY